jgi:hypothetical protein
VRPSLRRRLRTGLVVAGTTAALVTGAAACGTLEKLSAGQQLSDAADRLGEQRSLALELHLDVTPERLIALTDGEGEPMPREMAEFLTKARISVSVQARKPLSEAGEKDLTAMQMKIGGPDGNIVEYRQFGTTAYYRADFEQFAEIADTPMPSADEMTEGAPEGFEFVEDLMAGEWIKLDLQQMEKFAEEMGEDDPSFNAGLTPFSQPDPETLRKMTKSLKGVLAREVTVKDKGSRYGVDHLVADAPARTLLIRIFDALRPYTDKLTGGAELPTAEDLSDVPNRRVSVDFSVRDGKLAAASMDLDQLSDQPEGERIPLIMSFSEAGKVTVPSQATEVDLEALQKAAGTMGPMDDPEAFEDEGFEQYGGR